MTYRFWELDNFCYETSHNALTKLEIGCFWQKRVIPDKVLCSSWINIVVAKMGTMCGLSSFCRRVHSPLIPQHLWQFYKISQQQIWKFPLQKDNKEWLHDNSCVVWINLAVAKMGTMCTGLSLFCQRLPSASQLPPIPDSSAKFQLFSKSCKSQKSANIHH